MHSAARWRLRSEASRRGSRHALSRRPRGWGTPARILARQPQHQLPQFGVEQRPVHDVAEGNVGESQFGGNALALGAGRDAGELVARFLLVGPGEQFAQVGEDEALGADLSDPFPGAEVDQPVVRHWRALLNDAQILLHTHQHNQRRIASARPPVNSRRGTRLRDAI